MKLTEAREFVESHGIAMVLDQNNGINGVAVGQKDGRPLEGADDFCVTAFVSKKLTSQEMDERGVRSFEKAYSAAAGRREQRETDMDVIETGGNFQTQPSASPQRGQYGGNPPALNAQKPFRSLRCGIGVTNPVGSYPNGLSVGTAGFYMTDDDKNIYLVSNNHVIGGSNSASPGEMVIQPGTLDLTSLELSLLPTLASLSAIQVGALTGQVQLLFPSAAGTPNNRVDGAIAKIDTTKRDMGEIARLTFGGGIMGVAGPYDVDGSGRLLGSDRVYKVGRTTGYTEGRVTNIAAVVSVPYDGGVATFVGQLAVEATPDNVGPFSDSGDSGSGVLNDRHELIGLLFAGSATRTLINPIREVISELRASVAIPSLRVVHL
jgi:hypothetical protein